MVVADGTEEVGISESALGLLRTLDSDRASHEEDDRLIMHGCGAILMMGCPIVCGLADSVAAFFGTREKQIPDDWDSEQYEAFWREFDERTSRARAEVRTAGGGQPVD